MDERKSHFTRHIEATQPGLIGSGRQWPFAILLIALSVSHSTAAFADGKLLATPGVSTVEGTAGGGLVPWATLSGYATRDETAATGFMTRVTVDDFRLTAVGAAVTLYDRVEISAAHHNFYLKTASAEIRQDVFGIKTRLYGDLVYTTSSQISAGLQYKRLKDRAIASAVGAAGNEDDTDFYLSATKLHLGAVGGYNALWGLTVRGTRANQLGLLGFGGDRKSAYSAVVEATAALLLSRTLAVGVEYRQKPDNLAFAKEDDWKDVFIAYIPDKRVSFTVAYADLGSIAGQPDQTGVYLSLSGVFW